MTSTRSDTSNDRSSDTTDDPIDQYRNIPDPLKKQLIKVGNYFDDDDSIKAIADSIYRHAARKHRRNSNLKKIAFRLALLNSINSSVFLEPKWYPYVTCYDDRGHQIRLEKCISRGRHVFVLLGRRDNDLPVVIKWYQSSKRDTLYEINIYKRLRRKGCETPWFSSSYHFWDFPVLVMEKLNPLTKDDNEFQMAIDVLQQLKTLNQFGVHNDIKPGNIMKRLVHGQPKYLMIDHGGVATKKLAYGYKRWIWSPKWTSQKPHVENQLTTAKNDFLELGYTMKTMQNWRTGDNKIRGGFSGKLAKYMDAVDRINPRNIPAEIHDHLINILQE